jgi:hypothetical protein
MIKKYHALKLRAHEISMIRNALDWYGIETNICSYEPEKYFELLKKLDIFMENRPNIFKKPAPTEDEGAGEVEDNIFGF